VSYFGEVPGVAEGTVFANRAASSLAGVHRPLMAGICGNPHEGAESIVLSGGYEDDEDRGDVIVYTGHGGNDPGTGKQVADQALARGNLALVRSMVDGLPVRVVRGSRHASPLAPPFGYSYDGLFFVETYWAEVGKSGHRIWRFRLRKAGSDAPISDIRGGRVAEEQEGYDAGPAPRQSVTVSRIIRNTPVANAVKRMHDHACQVCGLRLETPAGPYAEAAHIRPLGQPHNGPDTADNILCLCPNHHLLFDTGALTIADDLTVIETGKPLRQVPGHNIHLEHVRYHRALYPV
jgi:putative restriction endonuclease